MPEEINTLRTRFEAVMVAESYPSPKFFLQLLLVLVLFVVLHRLYIRPGFLALPEQAYFEPVLLLPLIQRPMILLGWLAPNLILFINYRKLSWTRFENGRLIRYTILFVAIIVAWFLSTYEYNLYFNQSHYLSRIMLIVLVILIWGHPLFTPVFILFAVIILSQFTYPLGAYSITDKRVLFDILILFNASLYLKLFRRNITPHFIFLLLCIHASNYFIPGFQKLRLNWLARNELANLVVASYHNGWLAFYEESFLMRGVDWIKAFNKPLLIFTLVMELGAIFVLAQRWLALLIFFAAILLHLGIFMASGIFFWKWILIDVWLIILLISLSDRQRQSIFTRQNFVLAVFLIAFAHFYFRPMWLGWYDSPLSWAYQLEAVGVSGERYTIDRAFMAPYDIVFAQNRFQYLNNQKILAQTYGTVQNPEVAESLASVRNAEGLTVVGRKLGINYFDENKAKRFDEFIRAYFGHLNCRSTKTIPLNSLAAPHHIWSFPRGNVYREQEKIKQIQVRFTRKYFTGETLQPLQSEIIRVIDVPLCSS